MALGAGPGRVVGMVLRDSAFLVLPGAAAGIAAALASTRLIQSSLFGLKAGDPGTIAASVSTLLAVSLAAVLLPARRAARLDPTQALRCE